MPGRDGPLVIGAIQTAAKIPLTTVPGLPRRAEFQVLLQTMLKAALGSAIATPQRATSSPLPMRPSGTCLRNDSLSARNSASGIPDLSKPGVSTGPDAIALTRIPWGANS